MQENLYKVRWILNLDDPDRAGLFGTTSHLGSTPAAAAIASAHTVSYALEADWGPAKLHILRVSDQQDDGNLLSSSDLTMALRCAADNLPIDVICRPLC